MLYQPTIEKLHELRLFGMAKALQEQAGMPQCDALSFEDRLARSSSIERPRNEKTAGFRAA